MPDLGVQDASVVRLAGYCAPNFHIVGSNPSVTGVCEKFQLIALLLVPI